MKNNWVRSMCTRIDSVILDSRVIIRVIKWSEL